MLVPAPVASVPAAPNALMAALAAKSLPSRPVAESVSPIRVLPAQYEPVHEADPPELQGDYDFDSESADDWHRSVAESFEALQDDVPMPVAVGLEPRSSSASFTVASQSVTGEPSPEALRRRRARRLQAAAEVAEVQPSDGDDAQPDVGDDTDSGGEPINRGMLLKFLSSVRS
jgi:hypothetical protein